MGAYWLRKVTIVAVPALVLLTPTWLKVTIIHKEILHYHGTYYADHKPKLFLQSLEAMLDVQ